jgi:hypothetical protein
MVGVAVWKWGKKKCEYQKIGRLFKLREGQRDKKVIKLNKVYVQAAKNCYPNT